MVNEARFPHGLMRPEQKKAVDFLNESNKKYMILELPTGVGKSAIGYAACESSEAGGYYLTCTKQLQSQIVDQYDCLTIKGRANYKCAKNGYATTCETGPCLADKRLIGECIDGGICDYYCLRERIKKAKTFLTSYAYLFRCAQCADWLTQRDVMVFDEAHDLEKQLVGFAQIDLDLEDFVEDFYEKSELTDEMLEIMRNVPMSEGATTPQKTFDWMKLAYTQIVEPKWERVKAQLEEMAPMFGDKAMLKKMLDLHQRQYLRVDKLREKFVAFVETRANDWLYEYKEGEVRAIPLDVSWIFGKYVEPLGKRFVFMSATIINAQSFAASLGLPIEDVDFLSLDSPFPANKSPIFVMPTVETNYDALQQRANLEAIAESVRFFLERHPNEKGIIHCGNMKVAKYLKDNVRNGRLLIRYGDDVNQTILDRHIKSKLPTVLVSSSMLEGVDLVEDLSRWQLFIKMPWLSLGDKRVKRLADTREDWYSTQCWISLIQGAGRSTRSATDWSVTYVIDKSFPYWYAIARKKRLIPRWIEKRVVFR